MPYHKRQQQQNASERQRAPRPRQKRVQKPLQAREKKRFDVKLFGKWDSNVQINDLGLAAYVNLEPRYLPRSAGAHRARFHKSKMHVVERLALALMVPGHTGKRHRLSSGEFAGGLMNTLGAVEKALEIIEQREKRNPLEVLVQAIENAALREEIISYQLGSITAREAVITAPQRRVDKTLRYFAQGAYRKAFNKKKKIEEALADEIILAYRNSNESTAVREKERIEREATGAR